MLGHLKVLDLTDERGQLCGQMLGQLGADVVLVEPPGGSSSRRLGPFVDDLPHPDRSLWFWAFNREKRSIELDIAAVTGRAQFLALVRDADVVIESFAPGLMASFGFSYEELRAVNPKVVLVSLTPFGQHGPKAQWAATDLTVLAASGILQLSGDSDRPPARVSMPQAFLHGAAEAAVGALLAVVAARRDGIGQHVDVSAQEAGLGATQANALYATWGDRPMSRIAGGIQIGPMRVRFVNRCRDGFVSNTFLFGSSFGLFSRRLMEVVHEEGFCDEATRDKDWLDYTTLLLTGKEPPSELERVLGVIESWCQSHTKAELFQLSLDRRLLIVPVSTIDEVLHSPNLEERAFWHQVPHPELASVVTYPGVFARSSSHPMVTRRRPPLLGEQTAEVLSDRSRELPRTLRIPSDAPPLAGLKVLDFMWVLAGPTVTRSLVDYGATVIRVESTTRVDAVRTFQPFKDAQPGAERSGLYATVNAGKQSLTLNLNTSEGQAIARRLAAWADIVCESFSPKAMPNWGLDYASLKAINPGLIMLSSSLSGQDGPLAKLAGFGTMGAQLAGFGELGGWPDRPPAGPFSAYTDFVSAKFAAAALLAAVEHRARTGQGQHIDFSQAEASLHFLGPALLDYSVNGRVATRMGNASPDFAPHGVFPCAGEDRWVAIVVTSDEQWQRLSLLAGHPRWATDARFADNAARLANREAVEEALSMWTRTLDAGAIETALQAASISCHRCATGAEVRADPQLQSRGTFPVVHHAEMGDVVIEASRHRLSRTPARHPLPAPMFGQHNDEILRGLLGLSDDEIGDLIVAGALE